MSIQVAQQLPLPRFQRAGRRRSVPEKKQSLSRCLAMLGEHKDDDEG